LLLDQSGRVVECGRANVFFGARGALVTPDLRRCGVAGVMREHLLSLCRRLGIDVTVRDLPVADLRSMDECFICNSLIGVQRVARLDAGPGESLRWPLGPCTRLLQDSLERELFSEAAGP
jgi:4-amino-4-deoxychorismate lyase